MLGRVVDLEAAPEVGSALRTEMLDQRLMRMGREIVHHEVRLFEDTHETNAVRELATKLRSILVDYVDDDGIWSSLAPLFLS